MRDELYINNQPVDIGKTGIYLEYKSYILDDISKLNASHSYTIKAPRTAHNCRLINGADIIGSTSDFPKVTHNVRVLRDGIEIISNADLYLLSVTDVLEFTIVWNRYGELAGLKDKYLCDLTGGGYRIYEAFSNGKSLHDLCNNKQTPYIDMGQGVVLSYVHPVMYLNTIFSLIEQNFNVHFNIPELEEDICLPLLTRNAKEKRIEVSRTTSSWVSEGILGLVVSYGAPESNDILNGFRNLAPETRYTINAVGKIIFDCDSKENDMPIGLNFNIYDNSTNELLSGTTIPLTEVNQIQDGYSYVYTVDFSLELEELDVNQQFRCVYSVPPPLRYVSHAQGTANIENWIGVERDVLPYFDGDGTLPQVHKYYLAENLPKIKIIDFVKSIAWAFGLFCYEREGVIVFRPFGELDKNKSKALNWSDNIININSMSYKLDNVAKNNLFVYANDSDIPSSGASISIDNNTLEEEATIISSNFNAAKNIGYMSAASIKIFSKNSDEGGFDYSKNDKAYLLKTSYNSIGQYYKAQFLHNWDSVLEKYWQVYVGMMKDTRLLTCTMRLDPITLKKVDFAIPIYLKQLGAYFAIQNIKTKENDIAEVKLIKL